MLMPMKMHFHDATKRHPKIFWQTLQPTRSPFHTSLTSSSPTSDLGHDMKYIGRLDSMLLIRVSLTLLDTIFSNQPTFFQRNLFIIKSSRKGRGKRKGVEKKNPKQKPTAHPPSALKLNIASLKYSDHFKQHFLVLSPINKIVFWMWVEIQWFMQIIKNKKTGFLKLQHKNSEI